MNTLTATGLGLTVGGVVAYLAGTTIAYPGRAFSLTALMVGVTLVAVSRSEPAEEPA